MGLCEYNPNFFCTTMLIMSILKVYNMFHRQYMHRMLMDSAIGEHGEGVPANLVVNHKVMKPLGRSTTLLTAYCDAG